MRGGASGVVRVDSFEMNEFVVGSAHSAQSVSSVQPQRQKELTVVAKFTANSESDRQTDRETVK